MSIVPSAFGICRLARRNDVNSAARAAVSCGASRAAPRRWRQLWPFPGRLLPLLFSLAATGPTAAAMLRCQVLQGGESQVIEAAPAADPYAFRAFDIHGRFRFKPVVVGGAERIEYIKLYTYYETPQQPRLMHVAKFLAPALPAKGQVIPLSGVSVLISPRLGREIEYSCALVGDAP